MSARPDRTPRRSPLANRHPARPAPPEPPTSPSGTTESALTSTPAKPPTQGPSKVKTTYNLNPQVAQDARDAYWIERDEFASLSDFVEHAIRRQIEATKDKHGLDQLPRRTRPLPAGRPLRY